MSAIDFSRFVDHLATASGEVILPFFRTHLGVEAKHGKAEFDPVTAADRAGEDVRQDRDGVAALDHARERGERRGERVAGNGEFHGRLLK